MIDNVCSEFEHPPGAHELGFQKRDSEILDPWTALIYPGSNSLFIYLCSLKYRKYARK